MDILRIYNETIYDKYKSIEGVEDISSPLLVSSKRYLENVKDKPVMYIGQETNGWVNHNKDTIIPLDTLEDEYDWFMLDRCTSNSVYWQFIKKVLDLNKEEIHKHILWTNTLLVGKRYDKGNPNVDEKIKNLSLKNILLLYDYFKPSYIINVSGPNNPYYEITELFLKELGINIDYPTKDNVINIKDNYIWTYHPNYLRKSRNELNTVDKIKKLQM